MRSKQRGHMDWSFLWHLIAGLGAVFVAFGLWLIWFAYR